MELSEAKSDLLEEVTDLLRSTEEAISSHPPATIGVYENGKRAFTAGFMGKGSNESDKVAGLSGDSLFIVRRYMLASSFMSAWYHLNGDRGRRDKAANSCALLVAGFGDNPESVMGSYIELERHWRSVLKSEGLATSKWRSPSAIALLYPIAAGIWMSQRAPLIESIGYGVTQAGYLVGASALIFGSFRVIGVNSRWFGTIVGVALFVAGVFLVNV